MNSNRYDAFILSSVARRVPSGVRKRGSDRLDSAICHEDCQIVRVQRRWKVQADCRCCRFVSATTVANGRLVP